MDKKSFLIGLAIASVVWLSTILCILYLSVSIPEKECEFIEDDVIDTEFEQLMVNTRVNAYAHGYYECLRDTRPDIHMAYMSCIVQLDTVQGDEAFNAIVDAECSNRGLSAEDKEYLCTLLLD
jgi:hypothetical protein